MGSSIFRAVRQGGGRLRHKTLRPTQWALIGLETVTSISAVGGGIDLIVHPTTAMPVDYLHGTWFHTWRLPGTALLGLVGLCPALVAVATLRQGRSAGIGHLVVGAGLIAWIALEASWVVVAPGLQIPFAVIGALIVILALADRRLTRAGAR